MKHTDTTPPPPAPVGASIGKGFDMISIVILLRVDGRFVAICSTPFWDTSIRFLISIINIIS